MKSSALCAWTQYPLWMFCQVRCIILKNTKSQHLSLLSPCCLPLCLCFPSSPSLCVSVYVSRSLSLRGVRGRECSGERGWVGMLDLLHLPFGRARADAVQQQTPGERKGEQMDRAPGQDRKMESRKLIV